MVVEGNEDAARERAFQEARRAALDAAVERLEEERGLAPAPGRLEGLAEAWGAWTGAYRVIDVRRGPTTVSVRLEVDVDLRRLHKALGAPVVHDELPEVLGGGITLGGCGREVTASWVRDTLLSQGVRLAREPANGASAGRLEVRCTASGPIPLTHLYGARVQLTVRDGVVAPQHGRAGRTGRDPADAMRSAAGHALASLSSLLHRARGQGQVVILAGMEQRGGGRVGTTARRGRLRRGPGHARRDRVGRCRAALAGDQSRPTRVENGASGDLVPGQ